jgi:hypothetical protein
MKIIINNDNQGYQDRRDFGDSKIRKSQEIFAKAIRKTNPDAKILGKIADDYLDTKKSTDLVFNVDGKEYKTGLRNRKADCMARDFTVRRSYYGSSNSEAKKVHNTDAYIYTWENEDNTTDYVVIDMNKVEKAGLIKKYRNSQCIPNKDDDNKFFSIPIGELLAKDCIIDTNLKDEYLQWDNEDDEWN